jgi:hypothetical protein
VTQLSKADSTPDLDLARIGGARDALEVRRVECIHYRFRASGCSAGSIQAVQEILRFTYQFQRVKLPVTK